MAIEFECPACGATIRVKDDAAGRKGRCPKCKVLLLVPDPGPEEEELEPEPIEQEPELVTAPEPEPEPFVAELETIESAASVVPPTAVNESPQPVVPPADLVVEPTVALSQPDRGADSPTDFAFPISAELTPVVRRSARQQNRRPTNRTISVTAAVLGLLAVGAGGWLLYRSTLPNLSGTIEGERVPDITLAPANLVVPEDSVSKEATGTLLDAMSDGLPLRSEYISVLLRSDAGDADVLIQPGPRATPVRVRLGENAAVRAVIAQTEKPIAALRRRELKSATEDFFHDYAAYLKGGPAVTRLPEYRNSVALNSAVGTIGYAVEAVVGDHPFPCVYEDSKGNCYFFLPTETRTFRLRGRKLSDGSTPLPVDLEVTVVEAQSSSADELVQPADAAKETSEPTKPKQAAPDSKDGAKDNPTESAGDEKTPADDQ